MSSVLNHYGLNISEAMVFGLSSSIAFAFVPFVKLNGLPLIAYRMPPRHVIKGLQPVLGIRMKFERFRDADASMARLDEKIAEGQVVGLQTSVYWLPYFPEDMRFHFNAHNLIVYGKEGDEYLISDPVFESPVRCDAESLKRARFAKGALAPKGLMYYPTKMPDSVDLARCIPAAIKKNSRYMQAPFPLAGVRGIRYLARAVKKFSKAKPGRARLFVGHIIRMQEEIGTGGAGFRFLYACFLQEAAELTNNTWFGEMSEAMTECGDQWRDFALNAVKMCKNRSEFDADLLAGLLHDCAAREAALWQRLKALPVMK